jgi:hypothetical protein
VTTLDAPVTFDVENVAETLRTLRKVRPELARDAVKRLKDVGRIITADAKATVPRQALSGWTTWGTDNRLGWNAGVVKRGITVQQRNTAERDPRTRQRRSTINVLAVTNRSAPGSVFELAGRKSTGSTPSGRAMIDALDSKYGNASRLVWAAAERNEGNVERALRQALDDTERAINLELARR